MEHHDFEGVNLRYNATELLAEMRLKYGALWPRVVWEMNNHVIPNAGITTWTAPLMWNAAQLAKSMVDFETELKQNFWR